MDQRPIVQKGPRDKGDRDKHEDEDKHRGKNKTNLILEYLNADGGIIDIGNLNNFRQNISYDRPYQSKSRYQ
jgi:hypothetical protein